MTYPVEVKFFINYNWESEYHLNYRLLGYQKNATTGFWEFDDSYALPEAPLPPQNRNPVTTISADGREQMAPI